MKTVINRTENTRDSRSMAEMIQGDFLRLRGRVSVMRTAIQAIVAFRKAATMQVPVHWVDPQWVGCAMHDLLWGLIPSLAGRYAPNHPNPGQPTDGETDPDLSSTAARVTPVDQR